MQTNQLLHNIISSHIKKNQDLHIVFLSGWGQKPNIIKLPPLCNKIEYFDYLSYPSIDDVFDDLKLKNPDLVLGWSLGGQIAINSILQNIIKPRLLILLATPFQFMSDDSFDIGINKEIYDRFYYNLLINPDKILRKFHLMMLQDDQRCKTLKNKFFFNNNFSNLQYWLDYLSNFSAFDLDFKNFCQTKLLYGQNDKIVNLEQGKIFNKVIMNSEFHIIKNYSHIPFDI